MDGERDTAVIAEGVQMVTRYINSLLPSQESLESAPLAAGFQGIEIFLKRSSIRTRREY